MEVPSELKLVTLPKRDSHKGQNGRLLIIGGSHLFHSASLWALKVATRIVDLVHYSSVSENNQLVSDLKKEFRDGIVVERSEIESYIKEDDCILIGPGMMRSEGAKRITYHVSRITEIESIKDEGVQTAALTDYLLRKYPHKHWVIDAGALQTLDVDLIPKNAVLTPHLQEFSQLVERDEKLGIKKFGKDVSLKEQIEMFAKRHQCILIVKGEVDLLCDGRTSDGRVCIPSEIKGIKGGNAGMTKGGTGDVLAGLIGALVCKNDPWVATVAGAYINKQAGEALFKKVGYFFNASDLTDEIPKVMKKLLVRKII